MREIVPASLSSIAGCQSREGRAVAARAVCFFVEFSQLIHLPALDALRRTIVGHLALGSGFDPRDFSAYTAGVLAAVLLERAIERRRSDNHAMDPVRS
jgi:hypothetical protein